MHQDSSQYSVNTAIVQLVSTQKKTRTVLNTLFQLLMHRFRLGSCLQMYLAILPSGIYCVCSPTSSHVILPNQVYRN